MIVESEAIVLKARRYSESSKIVTLYTRDRGLLAVMAKGAMRPKSPFRGLLDPLCYLEIGYSLKEGRDLQNLTSADRVERFPTIGRDLDRTSAGLEIVELVSATQSDPVSDPILFEALLRAIRALDVQDIDPALVPIRFLLVLIDRLGYAIRTDACGLCDDPVDSSGREVPFGIEAGSVLCGAHSSTDGATRLSRSAFEALTLLSNARFARLGEYTIDASGGAELHTLLVRFLQYHVPGLRRLRVGEVIASLDIPDPGQSTG